MGDETAQALYAGSNGPVTMTWDLFAQIFTTVNDPLQAAVNGVIGPLLVWLVPVVRSATVVVLIVSLLAVLMSDQISSRIPTHLVARQMIKSGAILYLLSGMAVFTQWVSGPVLALPNEISGVILGATGHAPIANGGAPFDAIWTHAFAADVKAAVSLSFFTLSGWVVGLLILISALFSGVFIAFMFGEYLIAYVQLSLVVALAPIAVACLVSKWTRNFFSGWLAVASGAVLTLVMLAVLLSVLMQVQQRLVDQIMNAPPNANTWGLVGSALGMVVLTFIGAVLSQRVARLAAAIAGGVYLETINYISAAGSGMSAATSAAAGWMGGGDAAAAGASEAAPAAAPAPPAWMLARAAPVGRSLSGGMP